MHRAAQDSIVFSHPPLNPLENFLVAKGIRSTRCSGCKQNDAASFSAHRQVRVGGRLARGMMVCVSRQVSAMSTALPSSVLGVETLESRRLLSILPAGAEFQVGEAWGENPAVAMDGDGNF